MRLLEKTQQVDRLFRGRKAVSYDELALLLHELLPVNVYITDINGKRGCTYAVTGGAFPEAFMRFVNEVVEIMPNVRWNEVMPALSERKDDEAPTDGLLVIVPLFGYRGRMGSLILERGDRPFDNAELLLAEYAAAVTGWTMTQELETREQERARQKALVENAYNTLSFMERRAISSMLANFQGTEGVVNVSRIAKSAGDAVCGKDRLTASRSAILNAIQKFASAGLLEVRSLGMKGTYIKVKCEYLQEQMSHMHECE